MANTLSILDMAEGAIAEAADIEFAKILANIDDPNTSALAKREMTLKITLAPVDDRRREFRISVVASCKLAPNQPAVTTVFVGRRGGQLLAEEAHQPDLFADDEADTETAPRALKAVG